MKQLKYLIYYLMTALSAVFIGFIAWSYLYIVNSGIHFLWIGHGEHPGFLYQHPVLIIPFVITGALILSVIYNRYEVIPRPGLAYAAEYQENRRVRYREFFKVYVLAMMPLFLGASVGPEASLIGLFFMLASFTSDVTNLIEQKFGLNVNGADRAHFKEDLRSNPLYLIKVIIMYVITAYTLITLLGADPYPPFNVKLNPIEVNSVWALIEIIPFIIVGWLFAKFYQKSEHFVEHLFAKVSNMQVKLLITASFVALSALFVPIIILSGEATLHIVVDDHIVYPALILIVLAFAKVMLTHICISGNLKGGHIFPIIFSAFLLGDGLSILLHTDPTLTIAAVTSAMTITIFSNMVAVFLLLALFFPVKILFIVFIAIYLASERKASEEERTEV